jgi:hypothetical protein
MHFQAKSWKEIDKRITELKPLLNGIIWHTDVKLLGGCTRVAAEYSTYQFDVYGEKNGFVFLLLSYNDNLIYTESTAVTLLKDGISTITSFDKFEDALDFLGVNYKSIKERMKNKC